jgi:hypothetical protein
VTTDTGANDFIVIQRRNERQPGIWGHVMASITIVSGIGMISWLTLCNAVVVTTCTGTNHVTMIHGASLYRCPGCGAGLVAGIAGISAINMIA